MLAPAPYQQEKKKTPQLCRRRFQISLSQSSAPEAMVSTHLIEAHLALDLTIWATVTRSISSPAASQKALNTHPRPASRYQHLLKLKEGFDFHLHLQLTEQAAV